MNRTFSLPVLLAAAAMGLGILSTAGSAHALGPVDLEVGVKAGVGTNPDSGGGAINPLGFGLGGRAGLAFLGGIYLGGNVMYYLGGSDNGTSVHTLMYGGEAGYGFKLLDLLTIRPQVGLGNATFTASAGSVSLSNSNLYVEPGVTALVSFGLLFVGADANLLVFPGLNNSQAAFTLHGQVGVTF
jgi:hypothetical protein